MPDPTTPIEPIAPAPKPPPQVSNLRVDQDGNAFYPDGSFAGNIPPATPVRNASTPTAGFVRAGIGVTVAQIIAFIAKPYVPLEIFPQVDFLITTSVSAVLAVVGKMIRDRFPDLPTPV